MKNKRKWIAYLLTAAIVISPLTGFTAYAAGLGDILFAKSLIIGEETVLANGVYWNSGANDKITENYIEYEPGGTIIPMITYGNDIYGAASFKAAADIEENSGNHVLAGINGDFFNMNNGVPIGIAIKDGIIRTSGSTAKPSVGFYEDGTAIIGSVDLNVRVDGPTIASGVGHINFNKAVTAASGLMLYNTDFADDDTNKASIPTYNIILDAETDKPVMNGTIEATVESVFQAVGPAAIPEGKLMLSIASATDYPGTLTRISALMPGDTVTLSFAANEAWTDVVYAVGGGDKLITAGANVAPANPEINPHTAVGIKADGTVVFYTVDGRIAGHSKGTTLSQLADRLLELGCVEAVNMDGGGSTAIHSIYPGDSLLAVVNSPSQGTLRNCANYILLVNTEESTGDIDNIHLYPYKIQMMAKASQKFTVKATDENYYPVTPPASFTYTADKAIGTFDKDGIFTAGTAAATGKVTIKYNSRISNTAEVSVIAKPDSISITNQSGQPASGISVNAGDTVDLTAIAIYKKMPLVAQDKCFTWTVTGNIGTVDENGLFTAGNITNGTGTVSASAGGTVASVTINIVSEGQRLETFEGASHVFMQEPQPGMTVNINNDLTKVRYGYKSAAFRYDFETAGSDMISVPSSISFAKTPDSLSFWVYGDGSGNTLNLVFNTNDGEKEYIATALDFTGWKQIVLNPPAGTTSVKELQLSETGDAGGVFYLDQIVSGTGYYVDLQPPVIQLNVTGQAVTAVISDAVDRGIASADISLTYDRKPLTFTFNETTKTLNAVLPAADGYMHRLTVTASDESGNLQRSALSIPAGDAMAQPFIDMGKHWAAANTSYLYYQGIVIGVNTDSGLKYNPDNNMTRAEFAVIMSKWIGSKAEEYEEVVLPFKDVDLIPAWALGAVKVMYGTGIIQGISVEGELFYKPGNPISREEVMTIIGRTQVRGYAESDLAAFTDNGQISSWALPYVKTLVYQGVITGYDGRLWPKNPVTRAQVATIITGLN